MKTCTGCANTKPLADFYTSSTGKAKGRCKACTLERQRQWRRENPDGANAASRAWQLRNPERVQERRRRYYEADRVGQRERTRRATLIRQYGITVEQFDELMAAQGARCAICRITQAEYMEATKRRFAVDHDHKTGRVRGLLCNQCNTALGLLRESPALVERAADYLHEGTSSIQKGAVA